MTAESVGAADAAPRTLRGDIALMLGSRAIVLVLGVAGAVLVARDLGTSGRGSIAVALSFTMILVQFGSLGLQSANPYFAARDPALLPRIVANTLWLSTGIGLILVLAGVVVSTLFPSLVRGLDTSALIIVFACLPAALAVGFLHSILLGEGRAVSYNVIDIALAAGTLAGLAIGFGVFGMGVTGAIAVTMAPFWAGAIIYLVVQLRHAPPFRAPDWALMRTMFKYGSRVYVATALAFLVIRADMLLVNSYLGSSDTGLYAVAVSIGDTLYLLPTIFALNLFPRIAKGTGHAMTGQVFRAVAVLYFVACAISIPLVAPAIRILYGPTFSESAHLFYVLLPGIYALGLLTVLSYHFSGRGFPREAMLVWIPGLALNLVINFLFLRSGLYIAPLASSIAYTLLLILHVRLFARTSGGYRELVPRPAEIVELFAAARQMLRRRAIV